MSTHDHDPGDEDLSIQVNLPPETIDESDQDRLVPAVLSSDPPELSKEDLAATIAETKRICQAMRPRIAEMENLTPEDWRVRAR